MIVGLLKLNYGVLLQSIVVFEYCPVNGKKTELDLISATMDSIVDAYKELKEKYQNQLQTENKVLWISISQISQKRP